jgi:hypothetical protein
MRRALSRVSLHLHCDYWLLPSAAHALSASPALVPAHVPARVRAPHVKKVRRIVPVPESQGDHVMRRLLLIAALLGLPLAAQNIPHAGYVFPAGGQRGTSVEVRVGGQYLNGATRAYVSGQGVEAKVVEFVRPLTAAEAQKLRDEMQKLNQKRQAALQSAPGRPGAALTPAEQQRLLEIRDKLQDLQRRRNIPSIAATVVLQVTIAKDAAAGPRRLRVETPAGLTNPIVFCVGDLPEYSREPRRVGPAYNVVNGNTPPIRPVGQAPEPPVEVTLPVVVNGQMMPGTSDRYRFHATKGQHLIIAVAARELMPYLSDAVPGWFQSAVTLRDAAGKPLASADHYLFHPDPLLHYEIPGDGEYVAEIRDSIYRGREDFVYRMSIGELPVITGIFPLGSKTGANTSISIQGWNLPPAPKMKFKARAEGVYPVSLRNGGLASNSMPFVLDSLREVTAGGAAGRAKAQRLKLPVIVNGRIERPGEAAFFRFDGRAGEEVVAEVSARRLGSPLDSVLRLTDAAGKELARNDDFEDKGSGLLTHQADSYLHFRLPAKGTYYLELADVQQNGGPEYAYRLRISHPRPDFELRIVPSSFNLRAGTTAPFTVYAVRKDGFSGEIALRLKDAPGGFLLSGASIPAGQDQVRVTLSAPRNRGGEPALAALTGQAVIEGREVTRAAVPAEDMEQAFAYHHLVPEDAWMVRIFGAGGSAIEWRAVDKRVSLMPGAATPVTLAAPFRLQNGLRIVLNDPPEGISLQDVMQDRDGISVLLRVEAGKVKPGLKGNLILDLLRDPPPNPAAPAAANRRPPQRVTSLPAIPFEVVGQALNTRASAPDTRN